MLAPFLPTARDGAVNGARRHAPVWQVCYRRADRPTAPEFDVLRVLARYCVALSKRCGWETTTNPHHRTPSSPCRGGGCSLSGGREGYVVCEHPQPSLVVESNGPARSRQQAGRWPRPGCDVCSVSPASVEESAVLRCESRCGRAWTPPAMDSPGRHVLCRGRRYHSTAAELVRLRRRVWRPI
jgi:hypothetical protein